MLSYKVFSTTVLMTEDLSHLFWYCEYTKNRDQEYTKNQKHWVFCFVLILFFLIPDISLKYENVTLGYTHYESKQSDVFYLFKLILLLAKYFIHKCKFCKPFFNIFS